MTAQDTDGNGSSNIGDVGNIAKPQYLRADDKLNEEVRVRRSGPGRQHRVVFFLVVVVSIHV